MPSDNRLDAHEQEANKIPPPVTLLTKMYPDDRGYLTDNEITPEDGTEEW